MVAKVYMRRQTEKVQKQVEEIKKYLDPQVHGGKSLTGIWYANNKDKLLQSKIGWTKQQYGRFGTDCELRQRDLIKHFRRGLTRYYTNGWNNSDLLMMVDIDCHGGQDFVEANKALQVIAEILPGIQSEPSTNERGIHAYFKLHRQNLVTAEDVRILTNRFKNVMTAHARSLGIDVDAVELKGNPSVRKWDRKGNLTDITFGQLAKIPRTLSAEQIQDTAEIGVSQLIDVLDHLEKHVTDNDRTSVPKVAGSCGHYLIGDNTLDFFLRGHGHDRIKLLADQHGMPATKARTVPKLDDILILCSILHHFTQIDPNDDQTMPRNRIESVWTTLFETGKVDRRFNKDRYLSIKTWLMEFGYIDVIDETYVFTENGTGVSAKWNLRRFFYEEVAVEIDRDVSSSKLKEEEGHTCGRLFEELEIPNVKLTPKIHFKSRFLMLISDSDTATLAKIASHFKEWVLAA